MAQLNLLKSFSSENVHLPKDLDESSLPYPLISNISMQEYNTFIENNNISGYKLGYKNGTIYIIEMCFAEHGAVIESIGNFFRAQCPPATYGGRANTPIQVLGQPFHDAPDGKRIAPDLAVYPHHTFVLDPPFPHPGPPPSDMGGNPHARIILEVAMAQSSDDLKDKCKIWKQQPYVRSILGIKLYDVLATHDTAGRRTTPRTPQKNFR